MWKQPWSLAMVTISYGGLVGEPPLDSVDHPYRWVRQHGINCTNGTMVLNNCHRRTSMDKLVYHTLD